MIGLRYSKEELIGKLIVSVERNEPHRHYARTVERARFYRQIMTGEDQGDLVISYKTRETNEQKEQRIAITLSRTRYVANKIYNQYDEVRRTDNIVDNIKVPGNADAEKKIKESLAEFYADEHLSNYLFERLRFLTFYDPNSYLVVERREVTNSNGDIEIRSYPIEIYSEQVYDYEKHLGVLQYLTTKIQRNPKFLKGKKSSDKVYKYTMYAKDVSIELIEVAENEDVSIYVGYDALRITVDKKEKTVLLKVYDTKSKYNPAICVGYIPDAYNYGETYVSPLEPAEHLFRKLINRNSELELHRALHGFYQKYVIAQECDFIDGESGQCLSGILSASNETCPKCQGSGVYTHKTVQDVIYVPFPKHKDEHLSLSEYVHYVEIPEYITQGIEKDIQNLEREIGEAIFSNEVFDRSEVAATATESRLNIRGLYNALSSYADNWSKIYKHCVWLTAIYKGLDANLIVEHSFPSDFRLETVTELLAMRQQAVTSGAPYSVIQRIDAQIMQKQNQDDPEFIEMVSAIEELRPFKSRPTSEITGLLTLLPEFDMSKIAYIYFDEIIAELLNERTPLPFFKWPYVMRKDAFDEKVGAYLERYKTAKSEESASLAGNILNSFPS